MPACLPGLLDLASVLTVVAGDESAEMSEVASNEGLSLLLLVSGLDCVLGQIDKPSRVYLSQSLLLVVVDVLWAHHLGSVRLVVAGLKLEKIAITSFSARLRFKVGNAVRFVRRLSRHLRAGRKVSLRTKGARPLMVRAGDSGLAQRQAS